MHFLRYLAGVATFCPLNSHRIKRSRASEQSDQAIKDDFHRSKFLIPVANASTGDVYVTTPCSSCMMACMPTARLNDCTLYHCCCLVKINFARLQGGFVRTPPGYEPAHTHTHTITILPFTAVPWSYSTAYRKVGGHQLEDIDGSHDNS